MAPLFLTVFVDLLGFGIILPLLPFYAQHFGAEADIITLLVTAYTLTQFIFTPVWGMLSDRMGRKPVMLISLAGTSAAYLWAAFAPSLWMLFIARAVSGAMTANQAVANAYVADVTTPENRAKMMGRMGAAAGLGFVFGPALGGLLAGSDPAAPNFALPFLVAASLSAIAFVMALTMIRETLSEDIRAKALASVRQNRFAQFRSALGRPQFGLLVILMFLMPLMFSGFDSIFALWSAQGFGWGPLENGYMYGFMGLTAITVQVGLIGPLTKALGERRLLQTGATIAGIGLIWMPLASDYPSLLAATFAIIFGVCTCGPSLSSLVSQLAAPHERGTLLGLAQSSSGLARIAGPAWAGFSFANIGMHWPLYSGALAMVVMAILSRKVVGSSAPERAPEP